MTKDNEMIERQTLISDLRNTLENIAQELAPQYTGKVVVQRGFIRDRDRLVIFGNFPFLYIAEERPEGRFLGIFPRTERRMIFAVKEGIFGEPHRKKDIYTYLVDEKAEAVVRRHLEQYAKEHSPIAVHTYLIDKEDEAIVRIQTWSY